MEKITTSGSSLSVAPVNKKAIFLIHNVDNLQLLNIKIEGPNNTKNEPIVSVTDTKDVLVEFNPKLTGEYVIHVQYNDVAITGSPFTSKIYDINQIKVKDMPKTIQVDKPATFLVEASNAGPGMLEVIVNNGQVSSTPKALGPALYAITFIPKELIDHYVQIIFNGEMINGSPFKLNTVGTSFIKVQKPINDRISINNPINFNVKCPVNFNLNEDMFLIYSPVQKKIKPELILNENDLNKLAQNKSENFQKSIDTKLLKENEDNELNYIVKFVPEEVGDYIVDLKNGKESAAGCPFLMKVYDSKKVKITELNSGHLNKSVYFAIDASKAGAGNLEIIVSVNSRNVPNYVESEGNAKFRVNFKPKEAVPHLISVKFNGESVPGSPYTMQIIDKQNEINLSNIITNFNSLRMCSLNKGIKLVLNKLAIQQTLTKLTNVSPNYNGQPEIIIQTPLNLKLAVDLTETKNDYECLYIAKEVGPYQIFIYLDKNLIHSVPINCNVYDVSKVKVSGLEFAVLGKPITFQVDASHAGEGTLELVVTTRKCSVRAEVLMRSRGLYDVTFVPQQQTFYFVNVTFNEEDVPGSPFKIDIQPPNAMNSNSLDKLSQLSLTEKSTDVLDRAYISTSSNDTNQLTSLKNNDSNKIIKGFATAENATCFAGLTNIVLIEIDNNLLEQLQVLQKQQQHVIEACVYNPQGNLISSNLTYDLLSEKNFNKLKLDYTPKEVGSYKIDLINALNKQSLLNQSIIVECCDPSRVRLLNVTDGIVNKQQEFTVDCSRAGSGTLQLNITCKQQQVPFEIFEFASNDTQVKISSLSTNSNSIKINSKSGIFLIKYRPEIDLPHYIDVLYNGHQAAGCPQLIEIRDATELLTVQRESLFKSIQINKDVEIIIEESSNNNGLIELNEFSCKVFDCDNQPVKNRLVEITDTNGTSKKQYKLQFKPVKIGTNKIEILYLNNHLIGSPFLTECFDINKVKLQPIQNTNFVVNEKIFLSLDRKDAGYAELDVVVTSPLGRHLPIELTANDQKELICFIPTVQGKYKIAINYGQLTVPGTPITFVANQALVNENEYKNNSESSKQNTNGSIIQKTLDEKQSNSTRKEDKPIILLKQTTGVINERFVFTIDSNDYKGLPLINIDGPEQEEDLIVEEKNRVFHVSFVPVVVGIYEIKISWNGKEIIKQPLKVNIINFNAIKPKQNWKNLLVGEMQSIPISMNQQLKITFLANEAGPGKLTGDVILPNGKIQTNIIEQSSTNKYKLYFTPKQNGKYLLRMFYANLILPQCPLVATTSPQYLINNNLLESQLNSHLNNYIMKENQSSIQQPSRKTSVQNDSNEVLVTLKGQGLAGACVGQTGQFIIDGSSAGPGSAQCTLKLSESDYKTEIIEEDRPVLNVTEIQNKIFKVSYKAKIPGIYILNVLWGNKQASGCPLKIHITPNCDASLVEATGPGLKEGIMNKISKIFIDTSKAGPGQLTAHCSGPKKIADCSLVDEMNGSFVLTFTPLEIGKHVLTIKYGGENIPNSPFNIKIIGEPDASKVRVYGPGIEHGVLPLYQSRFVCDTKGAGAGQLTVRVRGPKGAFRVEMVRDNTKERSILCKYDPTEPGHYRIEVKWSNNNVPNSPFDVIIFDTQFELNRFLQNGSLKERIYQSKNVMPFTGTLPSPGTLPNPILSPPPPLNLATNYHKTIPNTLAHHGHLPIHPSIQVGPHYSLNHLPFTSVPINASLNAHINPQFIPNEFFNNYAPMTWRGPPHELH